jgi:hypothetical protein
MPGRSKKCEPQGPTNLHPAGTVGLIPLNPENKKKYLTCEAALCTRPNDMASTASRAARLSNSRFSCRNPQGAFGAFLGKALWVGPNVRQCFSQARDPSRSVGSAFDDGRWAACRAGGTGNGGRPELGRLDFSPVNNWLQLLVQLPLSCLTPTTIRHSRASVRPSLVFRPEFDLRSLPGITGPSRFARMSRDRTQ